MSNIRNYTHIGMNDANLVKIIGKKKSLGFCNYFDVKD